MNFPILKLMKNDFISNYVMQGSGYPHPFKKLCFVFDFDNTVILRVFSLNNERQIMGSNENGIGLTDAGVATQNIERPFKVGTLELVYNELWPVIGRYDSPNADFFYLRFEPSRELATSFIVYDIYYNDDKTLLATVIPAKKPSPPYGQD